MCDPVTAISAAAIAGGTLLNRQQQNAAVSANQAAQNAAAQRDSQARAAEMARQEEFRRRAAAEATASLEAATPASMTGAEDEATAGRVARLAPVTESMMPGSATADPRLTGAASGGSPTVVADGARELAKALTQARGALASGAFLRGAGDATAGLGQTLQGANSEIATQGLLRKGSLSAYDVERSRAVPTYSAGSSLLGDALLAGGTLGAGYAGRAAGAARAGTPAAAAAARPGMALTGRVPGPI